MGQLSNTAIHPSSDFLRFCHRNRYNSTSPMSIWPWRPPLRMPERLVWPPQLLRQLPRVTWTKRRWEGWQMKCRGRWNNMDSKVQSLEKRRQGRFWGFGSKAYRLQSFKCWPKFEWGDLESWQWRTCFWRWDRRTLSRHWSNGSVQ